MGRLSRRLHHLHRALGSVLCGLLLVWFASGAVMTLSGFPRYSERERLQDAEPLPVGLDAALPESLAQWLEQAGLAQGTLRLVSHAGSARWIVQRGGKREAYAVAPPFELAPLSAAEAKLRAERLLEAPVREVQQLSGPDQWTVPLSLGHFPLWRVAMDDALGSELYLSAASTEVVQRSERTERVLAWLGAIPHWIYPTVLRRERELWKNSVILLASAALLLTLCGLWIGLETQRQLSQRRQPRPVRDPYLRWHQRIGLGFGLLVTSWLFSGILSFTPFDWTGSADSFASAHTRLSGGFARAAQERVGAALQSCQREQNAVAEVWLRSLAGVPLVLCVARDGETRVVRLDQAELTSRAQLDASLVALAVRALTPVASAATTQRLEQADLYYYPTHGEPELALPVLRVDLDDAQHSAFYLDLRRGELAMQHTDRTRLERWLYHGLHSWDLPVLYGHRTLWRCCLWLAMLLGGSLSLLGTLMALRRWQRRRRRRRFGEKDRIAAAAP
jgi:hypothetical protein